MDSGAASPSEGGHYSPSGRPDAVYHDISPSLTRATRIFGGVTAIMIALAFIFSLVQGSKNSNFYLLTCNLIVSTFIGMVNAWWYRKGDLSADKYWYMMVLCGVICLQCLATDIFVFNLDTSQPSTPAPLTTTTASAPLITTTTTAQTSPANLTTSTS